MVHRFIMISSNVFNFQTVHSNRWNEKKMRVLQEITLSIKIKLDQVKIPEMDIYVVMN